MWSFTDICGRIAHEWPFYSPYEVAKLPYTQWRNLRTLYIRAHHVPPRGDEDGVKSIDVDEMLGVGDAE